MIRVLIILLLLTSLISNAQNRFGNLELKNLTASSSDSVAVFDSEGKLFYKIQSLESIASTGEATDLHVDGNATYLLADGSAQTAFETIYSNFIGVSNTLSNHLTLASAHTATEIDYDDTNTSTGQTNVQAVIEYLVAKIPYRSELTILNTNDSITDSNWIGREVLTVIDASGKLYYIVDGTGNTLATTDVEWDSTTGTLRVSAAVGADKTFQITYKN